MNKKEDFVSEHLESNLKLLFIDIPNAQLHYQVDPPELRKKDIIPWKARAKVFIHQLLCIKCSGRVSF